MIDRLKNLETTFSLQKAAGIVGAFALLSRLVGLVRDRLFASHFGAGDVLDMYYAAFRIPDLVFNLLILGTLSAAFIPVFTEWLIKDKNRAFKIAGSVLNISIVAMSAVCLGMLVFSRPLITALFSGFDGGKLEGTLALTRILLVSPLLFTVSNIFGSMLNAQKKFLVTSAAPILYNAGIIFGLLALYPAFGLEGLGYGVVLGAFLHLMLQYYEGRKTGFKWLPVFAYRDEEVKKIGKLFLPRIFGIDASQLSLFFGTIIGSFLPSGTIAVLNLANNLQSVPLGIFAISTAVAIFPVLAESYAEKDEQKFSRNLVSGITQILFFVLPVSILMLLYRAYIVRLIYGAGNFGWSDTILTFNTLGVFTVSLFAQSLVPLLARAFYARHNTAIPVLTGLFAMALNIVLSYLFSIRPFTLDLSLGIFSFAFDTTGPVGIALGFSIASIINGLILFAILRHKMSKEFSGAFQKDTGFDSRLVGDLGKIIVSSLAMGITGYVFIYLLAPLVNTRTGSGILVQSGLSAALAVATFLSVSAKLKLAPAISAVQAIKRMAKWAGGLIIKQA